MLNQALSYGKILTICSFLFCCADASSSISEMNLPIQENANVMKDNSSQLKPWMQLFQQNLPKLPPDPLSNAEPERAVITHLIWDVAVHFPQKELDATATYSYQNKMLGNSELILDTSNLIIDQILVNGDPVDYEIVLSKIVQKPDALRIPIPADQAFGSVSIHYRTTPNATGIFWVDPQFTASGQYPLVYTLFQPTEGASAIPGQHSPQVRLTYEINVKTDPGFLALSSVNNNPTSLSPDGEYRGLKMTRAIPLYLLSLHVGHLTFYPFDQRTGVYAEEKVMETTKRSFQKLPDYLKAAEELCGPYHWGVYRPIQLGWPFPYGAMEHPCASTFGMICSENPFTVPHELAHSWAGNDITNCNWQQFFWNEGLTTFLQHCISEKIWGGDYASMITLDFLEEAKISMEEYKKEDPDLLKLCSDGTSFKMTYIPYAKGALFFFMLQEAMGKESFAQFLKDYMSVFFQNSMSEERFLTFLKLWLKHEKGIDHFDRFVKKHQITEWLHGTSMPSNTPPLHSTLIDAIHQEIEKMARFQSLDAANIQKWDMLMQKVFLNFLKGKATAEQLMSLDRQLHFTQSDKMSIQGAWILVCIEAGYLPLEVQKLIISHIIKMNGIYIATRVCSLLNKTDTGRDLIQRILDADQGRLFPITRNAIQESLSGPKS